MENLYFLEASHVDSLLFISFVSVALLTLYTLNTRWKHSRGMKSSCNIEKRRRVTKGKYIGNY